MRQRAYFPSVDRLNELFEYRDGKLYNKVVRNSRTKVGEVAGSYSSKYVLVCIDAIPWQVSRIVFMMHNGYIDGYIDHINGNTHDNRIENLRAATPRENQCNHALSKSNKSGVKGVSWNKKHKTWCAFLRINGKSKNLGSYKTIEDAKEFLELVREVVHGDFANHGTFKENISWLSR